MKLINYFSELDNKSINFVGNYEAFNNKYN